MTGQHRQKWRRGRLAVAAVLVVLLLIPGASYARALTYPGSAGWDVRTVEWIRDNGGGQLVNAIENWYYSRQAPPSSGGPTQPLPTASARPDLATTLPPLPRLRGVAPAPYEGEWTVGPQADRRQPVLATAFFRPDAAHPGVVAGVAWLRQQGLVFHLVAGTREPGGTGWPEGYTIPDAARARLVAAFNSGYKMADAHGGFFADGRTAEPLRAAAASLVIHRDGTISIDRWAGGQPGPDVVAVRQNLLLVVDGGRPVPGLANNPGGSWGSAGSQFQYTWRSGVGTDRHGNLIYVAGAQLNLAMLAAAMAAAGIVRGMQLDIHTGMVTFNMFRPGGSPLALGKLLPSMSRPSTRYLQPDQRDFVYATVRSAP